LISGQAITEETVYEKIVDYKQQSKGKSNQRKFSCNVPHLIQVYLLLLLLIGYEPASPELLLVHGHPENLKSSFRRAGIYPYNPEAVPSYLLKPSEVYRNAQDQNLSDSVT
jgi:hypothetical protein